MAKFAYNNLKNINIGFMFYELNYQYYSSISYKKNVDFNSKLKIVKKLLKKLQKLIIIR